MTRVVSVVHRTHYRYDRAVLLSPHEIRLRPAPHTRNRVHAFALHVSAPHRLHWFHDAYGNATARVVFGEPVSELAVEARLAVDLQPSNPFDFLLAAHAEAFPFAYAPDEHGALAPYLHREAAGARLAGWLDALRARVGDGSGPTTDVLVMLDRLVAETIRYVRRMEPGVQSCERTLELSSGSCRDSSWLLAQTLRHFGVAARFVSGYLIQPPDDGGCTTSTRLGVDLHAWCEAYLPGAGWIGLDPTSGLVTAEMHIPLACAAEPGATSPIQGFAGPAGSRLTVTMDASEVPGDGHRSCPAAAGVDE